MQAHHQTKTPVAWSTSGSVGHDCNNVTVTCTIWSQRSSCQALCARASHASHACSICSNVHAVSTLCMRHKKSFFCAFVKVTGVPVRHCSASHIVTAVTGVRRSWLCV